MAVCALLLLLFARMRDVLCTNRAVFLFLVAGAAVLLILGLLLFLSGRHMEDDE